LNSRLKVFAMTHINFLIFEVWMMHFPEEGLYEHTFLNQILTLYGTSDSGVGRRSKKTIGQCQNTNVCQQLRSNPRSRIDVLNCLVDDGGPITLNAFIPTVYTTRTMVSASLPNLMCMQLLSRLLSDLFRSRNKIVACFD
jgi:hypothetical protein